jgi:hypothetical protein
MEKLRRDIFKQKLLYGCRVDICILIDKKNFEFNIIENLSLINTY